MKKKIKYRKQYTIILLVVLLFISLPSLFFLKKYLERQTGEGETVQTHTVSPSAATKVVTPAIPANYNIVVPYTVQAPFGNWAVHEESCEEAAILMYHEFFLGSKTDIDPTMADREMRAMKAWEVKNYSSEPDLSIVRLGQFAESYYGYKYQVIANLDVDSIKKEISAGHPVLVPVMTQSLKNPHYSPGNVYHILVIKGYDTTGVITNDAGVKEGKDWHYSWDILFSAIDAQNAKMNQGRVGLVLN